LGDNLFKPHRLYVNSDSTRLVDHQSILKDNSEFCFCAFTQWSYVDTCAAAFCPVVVASRDSWAAQEDIGKYAVHHPLSVMANFVAQRSTPRELNMFRAVYYVIPRQPLSLSSDVLFLRAVSEERQASLLRSSSIPHKCHPSQFDQSLDFIERSRSINREPQKKVIVWDRLTMRKSISVSTSEDWDDISPLLYVNNAGVTFRNSRISVDLEHRHALPGFKGILLEMAMALDTSPNTVAFGTLFKTLLPFFFASVKPYMYHMAFDLVYNPVTTADSADAKDLNRISDLFAFRRHHCIVASDFDPDEMPQHISCLCCLIAGVPLFYYTLRSTATAHIILSMLDSQKHLRQ
jgi:hypothetical protein